MTTVVWDGKRLASDSQVTMFGQIRSQEGFVKLYKIAGPYINPETKEEDRLLAVGFAGAADEVIPFRDWILKGANPDEFGFETDDVNAIVVCQNSVWHYVGTPNPLPVRNTVCIGSGLVFALSALSMGASAPEAVDHAIKHDVFSGGTIHYIDFDTEGDGEFKVFNKDVGLEAIAPSDNWL